MKNRNAKHRNLSVGSEQQMQTLDNSNIKMSANFPQGSRDKKHIRQASANVTISAEQSKMELNF